MQGKFPLPCQSLHTFPIKSTLTIDPFTLVDLTENLVVGGGRSQGWGHPMEDSPPHLAPFNFSVPQPFSPLSPLPLSSQEQNQILFLSLKAF